jgi:aspartate ammonia-lyase
LRAVENFPITGVPISIYPSLIEALASIKSAAAGANAEIGLLDAAHRDAIVAACDELRGGRLLDQFVVDVIQGGAGTSTILLSPRQCVGFRGIVRRLVDESRE